MDAGDMSEIDGPEAQVGEVEFQLIWKAAGDGLEGTLEAVNVCSHSIRLTGKPGLKPVGMDGQPLDTVTVVSLELLLPGYVVLEPGEKAIAAVGWAGWDGPPASGTVVVSWDDRRTEVQSSGPSQPKSHGPATNLWSSWFKPA
jgi:uncharacterized protein DUF4232